MKNKLLLIIGCAVIALSAIFLILYLVNSGLFAKPYNPPGALTTEIKLSDLGSASELNGNIAVVSVFADDKQGKWSDSKEDAEKISNIFGAIPASLINSNTEVCNIKQINTSTAVTIPRFIINPFLHKWRKEKYLYDTLISA